MFDYLITGGTVATDDQNDHISAREFDQRMSALVTAMTDGFTGVHQRLDRANGRMDKHDSSINVLMTRAAEHGVKISNLNREVFPPDDGTPPVLIPQAPSRQNDVDAEPITLRDLKRAAYVAGWVAGAIGGSVALVMKYGPAVVKALQTGSIQ